jgi:hypothetical protein
MHNDTPLGAAMHVKDLDRQAIPTLDPWRAGEQDSYPATAIRRALISFLRRLGGLAFRSGSRVGVDA